METLLNLIWLAVAVAAIWLWRFRWTVPGNSPRHSKGMEAVAMVCLLALLFPVISLTDDLHPETAVVDAASGKRNACLIAASAHHLRAANNGSRPHPEFGIASNPFARIDFSVIEIHIEADLRNPQYLASCSPGRSPPRLL